MKSKLNAGPLQRFWKFIYPKPKHAKELIFFFLTWNQEKAQKTRQLKEAIRTYHNLVPGNIGHLYLRSFISRRLNTEQKLSVLLFHYQRLQKLLLPHSFELLHTELGINCYSEILPEGIVTINLISTPKPYFREGALSLILYYNHQQIFSLSFTMVPQSLFQLPNNAFYISNLQQLSKEREKVRKLTRALEDIAPVKLLLYALEAIARLWKTECFLGVRTQDHLQYPHIRNKEMFNKSYDAFWEGMAGTKKQSFGYTIGLPLQHKPVSQIKSNHRKRNIEKQEKLKQIQQAITENLEKQIPQEAPAILAKAV